MHKPIDIIGVPIDFGANKRGVDMGPAAIRYSGLFEAITDIGLECSDLGNINVPLARTQLKPHIPDFSELEKLNMTNRELADTVSRSLSENHVPLILGGDHSIAIGSLSGVHRFIPNIGVLWMDAHSDFNTPQTSNTGNLHGMPLAVCTGMDSFDGLEFQCCVSPKNTVIIGLRSVDKAEAHLLKKSGITVFTMEEIDALGIREIVKRSLAIAGTGTAGIHFSFDFDVLDPSEAPGVGTPVKGGLTYRETHLALEMIAECPQLCSVEFVELNPILDIQNKTGELAVSLICSVLGKRIFRS